MSVSALDVVTVNVPGSDLSASLGRDAMVFGPREEMGLPDGDGLEPRVAYPGLCNAALGPHEHPRTAAKANFGFDNARLRDEQADARSIGHLGPQAIPPTPVTSEGRTRAIRGYDLDDHDLPFGVETPCKQLVPADATTGAVAIATTCSTPKTPTPPSPTSAIPAIAALP